MDHGLIAAPTDPKRAPIVVWPTRPAWWAIAFLVALAVLFLPVVVWKTVHLGQGDTRVLFRAGWAIWTGYPLYEVYDHHGWSYHYPPTFALFMAPFADPMPGYPQPAWALPYTPAVIVWFIVNELCLIAAVHLWACALERARLGEAAGLPKAQWWLRAGPVIALMPFAGDGIERGQVSALLVLLLVVFLIGYAGNRRALAAFALTLAAVIKIFPVGLAMLPLLRRDGRFLFWMGAWGIFFLLLVPMICLGPTVTLNLYQAMWTEHLSGILSGEMPDKIAREVSPGAYPTVGIGAMLARVAAGGGFYSTPLPRWANAAQYIFDFGVVAAIAFLGRRSFWSVRGAQPANGYALLVAGAVLCAAMPLMISVSKPHYLTFALPLMAVLLLDAFARSGRPRITPAMVGWSALAWTSLIALDAPWIWLKTLGPITWVLLLLAPVSLSLIGKSRDCSGFAAPMRSSAAEINA